MLLRPKKRPQTSGSRHQLTMIMLIMLLFDRKKELAQCWLESGWRPQTSGSGQQYDYDNVDNVIIWSKEEYSNAA